MLRRKFIGMLGSSAATWPFAVRAQQAERMRRIGVLMTTAADDPVGRDRMAAFLEGLHRLGWLDGRNMRIETRWTAGSVDAIPKHAAELVALVPEVILATGSVSVAPLLQATRAVPIVLTQGRQLLDRLCHTAPFRRALVSVCKPRLCNAPRGELISVLTMRFDQRQRSALNKRIWRGWRHGGILRRGLLRTHSMMRTREAIRAALERKGAISIDEPGVRLRKRRR